MTMTRQDILFPCCVQLATEALYCLFQGCCFTLNKMTRKVNSLVGLEFNSLEPVMKKVDKHNDIFDNPNHALSKELWQLWEAYLLKLFKILLELFQYYCQYYRDLFYSFHSLQYHYTTTTLAT